jgi:aryl-alcohol dehydrogenase-like predicted oxidoreductase
MEYRELGKTGLSVSAIGFGSVELGMDYGIKAEGQHGRPDKQTAVKVINKAVDWGINLFDTAPSYGHSENLLGSVIGSNACYIATKVHLPAETQNPSSFIRASIETSLENLRRNYLDVVQIHNATVSTINQSDIPEILINLREKGLIRFIGASVYEPENALAALNTDCFDVLQIAYNILDQRMLQEVIPLAQERGVGILSRSAYFKGVLTAKAQHLSEECEFLRNAASKVKTAMNLRSWDELAELALEFCLSTEGIHSVLVGIRTTEELEFAIKTQGKGILTADILEKLLGFGIEDQHWLNPANWPMS